VQLDFCGEIGGGESPALIKSIGVENQEIYEKVIDFLLICHIETMRKHIIW
jgi:hypothetical protein